jgi:hypothetical protein
MLDLPAFIGPMSEAFYVQFPLGITTQLSDHSCNSSRIRTQAAKRQVLCIRILCHLYSRLVPEGTLPRHCEQKHLGSDGQVKS